MVKLKVIFDLDQNSLGLGVSDVASPLQSLLNELPSGVQGALAWVPDFDLSEAAVAVSLTTGAVGSFADVADLAGNDLAWLFVFVEGQAGASQAAAGVFVKRTIGLDGVPLFGPLLSGVSLGDLGVTYATEALAASQIVLPPDAPSLPDTVSQGFVLGLKLNAPGATTTELQFAADAGDGGSTSDLARDRVSDAQRASATDSAGATPPVQWFTADKTLGPLTVRRVGLSGRDGSVGLALDAGVEVSGVSIALTGLTVGFTPSKAEAGPSVSLDGLAVQVAEGALDIAGSLTRTAISRGVEYDGTLLLRVGSYGVSAVGSYALVNGTPSLFVFGLALGDFGGPPAFFVTGLAAGFGVNRGLRLPAPDQVSSFPLIAAAQGSGAQNTAEALAQLGSGGWVPPQPGENWVAIGMAFTSFELVDGFAVLTVQFGHDLTFALLGIASLELPTAADSGGSAIQFAYVEVTLEAVLSVSEGAFSLIALLTPNSYIISEDCKLTGGLAVCFWFGASPHAGDFVISLGGYHPLFSKPSWYPSLPRLGFSWHLTDALQITGEAYFALTPACAMGGGRLAVTFAAASLKAWFTAQADFIMYWRPFWFEADVAVSIGLSLTLNVGFVQVSVSLELGVSVELWGPPLRGLAHVSCWVISFDVPINGGGLPPTSPPTLDGWSTFASTSLPSGSQQSRAAAAASAPICRTRPSSGLRHMIQTTSGDEIWLFGGDLLGLATESVIPASEVIIAGPGAGTTLPGETVNIYPLGNVEVSSSHEVCVAPWAGTTWQPGQPLPAALDVSQWQWTTVIGRVPQALWGARGSDAAPVLGSAVVTAVVGATGMVSGPALSGTITVDAGALLVDKLPPLGLALSQTGPVDERGPASTGDSRTQIAQTVADPTVAQARAAIVGVINSSGVGNGLLAGELQLLASNVFAAATTPPMVGPLGSTGPQAATATTPTIGATAPAAATDASAATTTTDASATPAPNGRADPSRPAPRPTLAAVFTQLPPAPANGSAPGARPAVASVVLDRWSTSTEHRRLRAMRSTVPREPEEPPGSDALVIWPGWSAVWELTPRRVGTLMLAAMTDLWLVALDTTQSVLVTETVSHRTRQWTPPAGATRVAVTAVAAEDPSTQLGWHASSTLRQIATQTFLGDRVIVRRQSPGSHSVGRRRREIGVTAASSVVGRNVTLGADGLTRPGYVDTLLPDRCRSLTVAMAPEPGRPDAPAPRAPAVLLHGGDRSARPSAVAPQAADFSVPRRALWLHALDPETSRAARWVRAAPPPGWRLDGVVASAGPLSDSSQWPPASDARGCVAGPASRVWWR